MTDQISFSKQTHLQVKSKQKQPPKAVVGEVEALTNFPFINATGNSHFQRQSKPLILGIKDCKTVFHNCWIEGRKESLAHTKWVCKYYIVFISKYRRKINYCGLDENIQKIIKDLCKQKVIEIIEGTYSCLSFGRDTLKRNISLFMGYLKRKNVIQAVQTTHKFKIEISEPLLCEYSWSEYRKYIREQEKQA